MTDYKSKYFIIVGYHGTFLKSCHSICHGGFDLTKNIGDKHWLGHGIYFYDDEELALWWSECHVESLEKRGIIQKPAVIKALVTALHSEVADLNTRSQLEDFIKFCNDNESVILNGYIIRRNPGECEEDHKRRIRSLFLDGYKQIKKYGIIIYTFPRTSPSYAKFPARWGLAYYELQICVTNNDFITNREVCYPAAGGL